MKLPLKSTALLSVLGSLVAIAFGLWRWQGAHNGEAVQEKHVSSFAQQLAPVWAADPANAGESLPPVGRSLFDFLVIDGESAEVPFPFEALTRKIDARLGCTGAGRVAAKGRGIGTIEPSCLKRVLIPLGRSLQRSAAAPEFFKYPRAVVAADTESSDTAPSGHHRMLLKDRLFLGYQEKANLIEVISYNESAGRFEFQLVKDYRVGATPRVVYANRAVCVACHQNHAPLFSRQVWDETNANPRIATLLAARSRTFYGIPVARGVDIPNALDDATERANLLEVYQKLWREGCDDAQNGRRSARCRAAILRALLQYRLSSEYGFDQTAPAYRENLLALLGRTAKERWPGGLAIPNPDIPNRDPLAAAADDPGAAGAMTLAHVPVRFDPLVPREPLEIWPPDANDYARRMIDGLSQFIAAEDVRRLDAHLFAVGSKPGRPRRTWSGECRLVFSRPSSFAQRLDFRCPAKENVESALRVSGHVEMPTGKVATGTVTHLSVSGVEGDTGEFEVHAERIEWREGYSALVVRAMRQGRHVRLVDGNAVDRISLRWRSAAAPVSDPRHSTVEPEGEVPISALDDFAPVASALAQLAEDEGTVEDLFAAKPFRRAAALPALFARLGMPTGGWCCLDDKGMASARLDEGERAMQAELEGAKPLYRYCALCHQTPEPSPPNFLYGDADRVATNLKHCAERIFFRLSMWQLQYDDRPKTPMPPMLALRQLSAEADKWPGSAALAELRRHAADLLQAQTGRKPDLDRLLNGNYENLRSCLPSVKSGPERYRAAPSARRRNAEGESAWNKNKAQGS